MTWRLISVVVTAIVAAPAAAGPVTPLFAAGDPIRLEIRGPISAIVDGPREKVTPRPSELSLFGSGERHPIALTPRGITRLRRETCRFPPLRIEFVTPPAVTSLFAGQRRLKLVTHCRQAEHFQQYVLLEYAAYRLYNLLTPASFRVRLATLDYINGNGRPYVSRVGFLIEDKDDLGRRIGQRPAAVGDSVGLFRLEPRAAARSALFQYMIGNLDWSMKAGPAGEGCCHNSRLFALPSARSGAADLLTVPYDFDFSGLVNAPYAVPPDGSDVSVRRRVYKGYCHHNRAALLAAVEFRSLRPALLAEFAAIPQLDVRTRRKAVDYLEEFFAEIASDERMATKLLAGCLK
ncbi:MAG TPA: hypothetical protein VNI79_02750 [Sphingomicrobium sp.]|nr:hypothetical protein [Sphingomicrobium sp.]